MKIRPVLLTLLIACASCKERQAEVAVTETRELTTRDAPPLLDASSDQRFRDAKPSPVRGTPPAHWLAKPATQMRLLNYRFGDSGRGEVFVGLATGGILPNANRWLNEFGQPPIAEEALAGLKSVDVAGEKGVLLTAEGTYSPGRGQPPADGYGLAGIIADRAGRILTIKMVGPKDEVAAEISGLESFATGLKWTDDPSVSGR